MPKSAIDYSKTFIYKLCCNDPSITDVYVGHTTNVVKRRCQHKSVCNNISHKDHNTYVYQFIRNNGGWDNWTMIVLIELSCKDKNEALREERKHLEELQATLNKNIPSRNMKEYYEQHKSIILEYNKEYTNQNKEKIAEYKKAHNKKYREQNREKIREANRQAYLRRKLAEAV